MSFLRFLKARNSSELGYAFAFGLVFTVCAITAGYLSWTHWKLALLNLLISLFSLLQLSREVAALLDQYLEEKDQDQNGR